MPNLRCCCVLSLGVLVLASSAWSVSSSFDADLDGWTFTSGVSWQSSGGNPGGYAQFNDAGPANGGQFLAPASYLGDWLSDYGPLGTFSVDYRLLRSGVNQPFPMWVRITGSGGAIGKNFPGTYSSAFGWTNLTLNLTPGDWALLSGTFAGCLSNVTEVLIFMSAATSADEITGIDNVSLVPEPSSLIALGLGVLTAARRKRSPR